MQPACTPLVISVCSLQQLDNTAWQAAGAVTPTSTLSAWCPSNTISNVLDGSGSAVAADAEQVQKDVRAHPLISICEEWQNDATDPLTRQVMHCYVNIPLLGPSHSYAMTHHSC